MMVARFLDLLTLIGTMAAIALVIWGINAPKKGRRSA